ncbi:MAG: antibiotic biosynthesis monooxygenase [Saprospiraceae bacterium]|nr:antibiotic biosynthesis monooxygenase [Saprospiraceae bacterium]
MRAQKSKLTFLLMTLTIFSFGQGVKKDKSDSGAQEMMIRIAAIEVDSNYLNEYLDILKGETEASVKLEPGVVCIYPMFQKEHPTYIRLLEIYTNKEAYETHLTTSHFKYYKETTLKMVKSLKLIDMEAIDAETMPGIFTKLN